MAQFLISKNCPINGIHNQFVFSFFHNFEISFLFVLLKIFVTTGGLFTSDSCMYKQQFRYCRIIITKWSTSHCSSLLVFLNNLPQNNPLSSFFLFFLFFQFTINLVLEKQGQSSVLYQVCNSYSVNLPAVKFLVENGADVNEINQVFSNLIFFNGCFWARLIIFFERVPLLSWLSLVDLLVNKTRFFYLCCKMVLKSTKQMRFFTFLCFGGTLWEQFIQTKMVGWKYCAPCSCTKRYVGDSETFVWIWCWSWNQK